MVLRRFCEPYGHWTYPARVIADSAAETVLWLTVGTPWMQWVDEQGRQSHDRPAETRFTGAHTPEPSVWRDLDVVVIVPAEARSSVYLFFRDEVFQSYYVNLEDPSRRWERDGVRFLDSRDHQLDVLIAADCRAWQWKDEEDLAAAIHAGRFSAADEVAMRAEGERMVRQAHAGAYPFDGSWRDFRPDPAWTTPELPEVWNVERPG